MSDLSIEGLRQSRKEALYLREVRYATGKPCKRGHIAPRLVSNAACLACVYENRVRYRAENLERVRARDRAAKKRRRCELALAK